MKGELKNNLMKFLDKYNMLGKIGFIFIAMSLISTSLIVRYQQEHGRPLEQKRSKVTCIPVTGTCERYLNKKILDESLRLGTGYYINNQKDDGRFVYELNWKETRVVHGDNQVRQAGALWGLALIYHETGDEKIIPILEKSFAFFSKYTVKGKNSRSWIDYPESRRGKTGTVALLSLAMIEVLRSPENLSPEFKKNIEEALEGHLNFLISLRTKDGNFFSSYRVETGSGYDRPSPYSDGETLLALVKSVRYLKKDIPVSDIIDSAEQMHNQYVIEAQKKDPDARESKQFFQWGIMSFYEIHEAGWDEDQRFAERSLGLADWMIDVHCILQRSNNIAYAIEGIVYSWDMAVQLKNYHKADKFNCAIDKGLTRITSWQVGGPLPNRFLRNQPKFNPKVIGGIMNGRKGEVVRIDVVQHQMHAILMGRRLLYKE